MTCRCAFYTVSYFFWAADPRILGSRPLVQSPLALTPHCAACDACALLSCLRTAAFFFAEFTDILWIPVTPN
jgi:hypothetical protein